MLWTLRAPKATDVGFVFNSWLKSYRDGPANTNLTHTTYYREMHRCMERALVSPTCTVVVACSPEEEDVIFGYAVGETIGETLVIHFVYVKHPFRNFGMGRALEEALLALPHKDVAFSCWTKLCKSLMSKRKYLYNPFLLWSHT